MNPSVRRISYLFLCAFPLRLRFAPPPGERPKVPESCPTLIRTGPKTGVRSQAVAGPLGIVPTIICNVPATIGTEFKIGLGRAPGGASAWLGISTAAATSPLFISGAQIHLDAAALIFCVPFVLPGAGAGQSYATFKFDVPDAAVLAGIPLFAQWLIFDLPTASFAATTGAAWMLF